MYDVSVSVKKKKDKCQRGNEEYEKGNTSVVGEFSPAVCDSEHVKGRLQTVGPLNRKGTIY